jgi:hypothetical protein
MAKLWIVRGAHEAPGWNQLRKEYEDKNVDIIHLDAKVCTSIPTAHRCTWPPAKF